MKKRKMRLHPDIGIRPAAPDTGLDERIVLDTAMEAGQILLKNGAEIFRVEETMTRICRHYGVAECSFFVVGNGIITTGGGGQSGGQYARVDNIPVRTTRLDRIVAVNQLSREIEQGMHDIASVRRELDRIRHMPNKPVLSRVIASGISSAAFCYLFGGGLEDTAAAFLAGFLLQIFMIFVANQHMSRIVGHILGGAVVTIVCVCCRRIGMGHDMNHMIIGSIIPLVPGLSFTNGIRDIADGDYISGSVRMLDALLVFMSIAIGVGMVFTIVVRMGGVGL